MEAVPFCRFATFPPHCGGIDPCPTFDTSIIFHFQFFKSVGFADTLPFTITYYFKKAGLTTCFFTVLIFLWCLGHSFQVG